MEPQRLSKSYKFVGHAPTKGAVVSGAVYIDADGMYLLYRSHHWQTALIIGAAFGPLGMVIAALMTWRKTFAMPVETLPLSEMPPDILDTLNVKKPKPDHTLAVISRDAILGYHKPRTGGVRFRLTGCEVCPIGPKSRVVKELETLGYPLIDRA